MWLALNHRHPGLVRRFSAEDLVISAPDCGSWVTARPDGTDGWVVTAGGPRDIWGEIQDTAARWRAAGEPDTYRLEFRPSGKQQASAGSGSDTLSWQLTAPYDIDKEAPR
ncbi:hypothetical protein [Actinoallomurus sp. NPDC052274]|uniref:hypothetical protein n=1 Tax=Actinoallomurus sp. NPDC052274 TaxID=3155420 RepID=UPI00341DFE04